MKIGKIRTIIYCSLVSTVLLLTGCKSNQPKESDIDEEIVKEDDEREAVSDNTSLSDFLKDITEKPNEYLGPAEREQKLFPNRYFIFDGNKVLMPMTIRELSELVGNEFVDIQGVDRNTDEVILLDASGKSYSVGIDLTGYLFRNDTEKGDIESVLDEKITYLSTVELGNTGLYGRFSEYGYEDESLNSAEDSSDYYEEKDYSAINNLQRGYFTDRLNYSYVEENYMAYYLYLSNQLDGEFVDNADLISNYLTLEDEFGNEKEISIGFEDITDDGFDELFISDGVEVVCFTFDIDDYKLRMLYRTSSDDQYPLFISSSGALYREAYIKNNGWKSDTYTEENCKTFYHMNNDGTLELAQIRQSLEDKYYYIDGNQVTRDEFTESLGKYGDMGRLLPTVQEVKLSDRLEIADAVINGGATKQRFSQHFFYNEKEEHGYHKDHAELFDIDNKDKWQKKYRRIIKEFMEGEKMIGDSENYNMEFLSPESFGFGLYDLNGDDVPELLLGRIDELNRLYSISLFTTGDDFDSARIMQYVELINKDEGKLTTSDIYNLGDNLRVYKMNGNEVEQIEYISGDSENVDGVNPWNKYYRNDEEVDTRTYYNILREYEYNLGSYQIPFGKTFNEKNLNEYFDMDRKTKEKKEEKKAESDDEYKKAYEAFISGEIADSEGKTIDDYNDYEYVRYYYIRSEEAKHDALVISYADACVYNDIYYYDDGEIKYKAYFGRRAISGTALCDETYLLYETVLPCSCEITDISKLDDNYNEVPVRNYYYCGDECIDGHEYGMEGYEKFDSEEKIYGFEYITNILGGTEEEPLYDTPEYAIKIK